MVKNLTKVSVPSDSSAVSDDHKDRKGQTERSHSTCAQVDQVCGCASKFVLFILGKSRQVDGHKPVVLAHEPQLDALVVRVPTPVQSNLENV